MTKSRHINKRWTKEECRIIALKYKTKKDYRINDNPSYVYASKKHLINEICQHMVRPFNVKFIWTKENCTKEALKYNNKKDFCKFSLGAYKSACKNKWLDEICSHMINARKSNKHWTKELIHQEALKYNNRKDFRINSYRAYLFASKNNWLDYVCSHMEKYGNLLLRIIYVYEFPNNYAYVGLTSNLQIRKSQHLTKSNSPVYKHIIKTNLQPECKTLIDNYIDVEIAQKLEKEWCDKYRENGWNMLNSNRTGGIGGHKLPKNRKNK